MLNLENSATSSPNSKQTVALRLTPNITPDPDYLALRASYQAYDEGEDLVLDTVVDQYLAGSQKVMLLLGDSGSGKSLYCQQLVTRLWQEYLQDPDNRVYRTIVDNSN